MMNLPLSTVSDINTRDCLRQVQDSLNLNPTTYGQLKLFNISTTGAVTGQEFFHNLGFIPSDILVTKISSGSISFNWASFTKDKIYFTTTAGADIRLLIGRL